MPKGAEAKLRRRNQKKEASENAIDMFGDEGDNGEFTEDLPLPPSWGGEEVTDEMPFKKKKKKKSASSCCDDDDGCDKPYVPKKNKEGIKTLPLIFLIILTGSAILPALIYAGDFASSLLAKNDVMGSIGFRLGIGSVPRKRVLSFYEKHAPEKVPDVPKILSKHYGDYPKLVKKLERKYQDYGYFLGWEEDEAPTRMVQDYLSDVYKIWIKQWNRYAPQVAKTAARNARYNFTNLYKTGRKLWKKQIWPLLEPVFGVPDGADKQKRQDAAEARKRRASSRPSSGGRRKNTDFRDDQD